VEFFEMNVCPAGRGTHQPASRFRTTLPTPNLLNPQKANTGEPSGVASVPMQLPY